MMTTGIARRAVAMLVLATSCGLPRDAEGTLDRVRGGVLRVGISESRPWTTRSDSTFGGTEVQLVNALARELGARAEWHPGSESVLLAALEARQLDLVIGGLTADTPWSARVVLTNPYDDARAPSRVMATAPGENAWLVHVEDFLSAQRAGRTQ